MTEIDLAHFYTPDVFATDPEEVALINAGTWQVTHKLSSVAPLHGAFDVGRSGNIVGRRKGVMAVGEPIW